MKHLIFTHRLTSVFMASVPQHTIEFNAYLYAIVPRKPETIIPGVKYGEDVRLDPCYLDWDSQTITMYIPLNINPGINGVEDLDPHFYESIEAAFLALLLSVAP